MEAPDEEYRSGNAATKAGKKKRNSHWKECESKQGKAKNDADRDKMRKIDRSLLHVL